MELIGMIALIQAIVIVIVLIISAFALSDVIYNHIILSKYCRPSAMVNVNILDAMFFVILGLGYGGYLIAWWRPEENCYNARIIFWLGLAAGVILCTRQIGIFYLGIERIINILWPIDSQIVRFQMSFVLCTFCISSQLAVIVIGSGIIMSDSPGKENTNCRALSCLMNSSRLSLYLYFRLIWSTVNSIVAIILCIVLRKTENPRCGRQRERNAQTRLSTKVAITTFFSTFVFDFVPHVTVQILYKTLRSDISHNIGPYSIFFGSLYIVLSALFCNHSFRQQRKKLNKRKMAAYACQKSFEQLRGT